MYHEYCQLGTPKLLLLTKIQANTCKVELKTSEEQIEDSAVFFHVVIYFNKPEDI